MYKRIFTNCYYDKNDVYTSCNPTNYIADVGEAAVIYKAARCYKVPIKTEDGIVYGHIPAYQCKDQLLRPGDTIYVNNEKYIVVGSGVKMYRATNGKRTIRKNYLNSKGELTFECRDNKQLTLEKQRGSLSEQGKRYFKQFEEAIKTGYVYSEYEGGIFKNFELAIASKQRLIDILSKHPNWNNEELCIEVPISLHSDLSNEVLVAKAEALFSYIIRYTTKYSSREIDTALNVLRGSRNLFIQDNVYKFNSEYYYPNKLKQIEGFENIDYNKKASRVARQICSILGVEPTAEFERLFTEYSDLLSTKPQKYKFILSVNPADFITMSHGNSWSSCHSTEKRNCYHAGCMSYATDDTTMIAYTIPSNAEKDYFKERKVKRQLFMLSKHGKCLMQSKMYPKNTDANCLDIFSKQVLKLLSESGHEISEGYNCDTRITSDKNSLQYPDYKYWKKLYGTSDEIKVGNISFGLFNGVVNRSTRNMLNSGYIDTSLKYIILPKDMTQDTDKTAIISSETSAILKNGSVLKTLSTEVAS